MKPKEVVDYLADFIENHLSSEDLSVDSLGKMLFLHPVYLNRLFKREKGITLGQYIIRKRMKLAIYLLLEEKMAIHEIAERTGYSSSSSFSLAFKRHYHCSPSRYQENHMYIVWER